MLGGIWRSVYLLTIGFRFLFPLANSYIHPDEHFQTFEPLAAQLLGFSTNPPWEFTSELPARSYGVLLLVYAPAMQLAAFLGLSPLQTWYLVRLYVMILLWIITDWCLYHMLPTKQERFKAILFTLTSYVTLVYQSHTFSNLVETVLVMLTVYLVNELRFLSGLPSEKYKFREVAWLAMAIGVFSAIGIFNRVTFPVFFVWPAYHYMKCWRKWRLLAIFTLVPFLAVSYTFVVVDTIHFGKTDLFSLLQTPLDWSQYVITPLNNLVYNSQYSNLAHHGIHPRYTHILVNLPQILGPGLLFVFYKFRNRYWNTTPFQAAVSALVCLSMVPHQELRFLTPVVPLLCSCFDLHTLSGNSQETPKIVKFALNSWLVFNTVMGVIMGIYHQGGIASAADFFHQKLYQGDATVSGTTAQIWWRTYSPPTWMLGDTSNSTQFVTISSDKPDFTFDSSKSNYVLDTMGLDVEDLHTLIALVNASRVYLVTPTASFNQHFRQVPHYLTWLTATHLDMDHLDFSNWETLKPGLGIYELL